jgi:hypothetical protein
MRHKFHQFTRVDLTRFVTIRVNSCPKFVAISVIGVYDAGAISND